MPKFELNDKDGEYSLLFFPLIGVFIGALVICLNGCAVFTKLPAAVRIVLTAVIPLLVTGGIHVDGFMDTEDALRSYSSCEKKLEIMKDPHTGAFAVIAVITWAMCYIAAITAIFLAPVTDKRILIVFGSTFVISRILSALTSLLFIKARPDGMLKGLTAGGNKIIMVILAAALVLTGALIMYLDIMCAVTVLAVYALFTLFYRNRAYTNFGGVTGDTAGWFLTVGEMLGAAALAVSLFFMH